MVKSNNFSWMYEKTKGIRNTVSIKVNKYFISFWRKGFRIVHILVYHVVEGGRKVIVHYIWSR